LYLFGREKDKGIRLHLAHALLCQFAPEGIEAARQLLVGRELDFESRGLRSYLLETCTHTGERFPEDDEWLAAGKADKEDPRSRVMESAGDRKGLVLSALEKLPGTKAADVPKVKPPRPPAPRLAPRKPEGRQRVGRNDPCACGSGKKFKNCCMKKRSG